MGKNAPIPIGGRSVFVPDISFHSVGKPIDSQLCVGGGDRLRGCFISLYVVVFPLFFPVHVCVAEINTGKHGHL